MEIRIVADSPEAVQKEIVAYLEHRSNQFRNLIITTSSKREKDSYETQANAIRNMANEIKGMPILNLSEPQDWDSFEQMEDGARMRAGKAVHLLSKDPWKQLSMILNSDDGQLYYDSGPNMTLARHEARKIFDDVKASR